jgi:peptide/nickel transport system substrate-binding protein
LAPHDLVTRAPGRRSGLRPRPARGRTPGGAAAALLAATVLFAANCGRPPTYPARPLRIGLQSDWITLDPHAGELGLPTLKVLRNVYDALTALDAGDRVEPALAESWENPNELTWIFHLRRGVSFHDGRGFTARDVLFSFDRARRAPASRIGTYLIAIDKVLALDPHTVEITTRRPYPILLNKIAFVLIVPAGSPPLISLPVGTGPFRLVLHEPGRRVALRAFDHYWGGAANVQTVEFLVIRDHDARVKGLLDGGLDIVEETGADAGRIRAAPGCRIARQTSLGVTYLELRSDRKPFDDLRTRRALSLALDRSALVQALGGEGEPIGQMVTRSVFGFAPDIPPPAADLPAARALLAAAGYADGLGLALQIHPDRRREPDALVQQLRRVGIRVRTIEWPLAVVAADVDLLFASWISLSGDASDFFDVVAHSPSRVNGYGAGSYFHHQDPALDLLIENSEATLDMLTRRIQLEHAMHAAISDFVFIPLYSTPVLYGTRDDVDWQPRSDRLILVDTIRRHPPRG